MNITLPAILFALSIVSGMLGIGVGMPAVPFLSIYLADLVNEVQPLSLLLNGVTALLSCIAFANAGYVQWRRASLLAITTTLSAPWGSVLALSLPHGMIWAVYLLSAMYVTYSLLYPRKNQNRKENFRLVLWLSVPISVVSSFLGVGAGFLLVPALIACGFDTKNAAGMNAFAVTPSSFAAMLPHSDEMHLDLAMVVPLLIAGALGSYLGGWIASRDVPDRFFRYIFAAVILFTTLYRAVRELS